MIIFFVCIGAVIVQRMGELIVAKRHSKKMFEKGAVEIDRKGYIFIVCMHSGFFIVMILEFIFLNRNLNLYWYLLAFIFVLAQALRYWAIKSLGINWNTRIIVLKGSMQITSGPYKYINHPNYIAVETELIILPLIFSCYITSLIFGVLNFFVLKRRIKIENKALKQI